MGRGPAADSESTVQSGVESGLKAFGRASRAPVGAALTASHLRLIID